MTRFIIIAASLALACNAIETGECVLGSEASCGGSDSSALLQGRLRVNEEDAKAVETSINTDLVRRNAILTFTVFSALTNVTRTSSKVGFHNGYADEGEVGIDDHWEALHSQTEGLRNVMTAIGAGESCPAQSAEGDYSHLTSIKLCVDHALCIMCQNVTTQEDNKACTMLRELYGNFEDTTWGHLWKTIHLEKVASDDSSTTFSSKGIDYMDPTELACKGVDFAEATASFAEINSKATAHQASAALVDAARTTHALLDSHQENSSVDATISALQRAWEPPCELLNCDHTNYWDLVGASFSHSIALIESGASSHHMQVHLRTRQRLEIRMGAFLAANGWQFASKIYRTDGTSSEAQMNRYVSHLVVALTQKMTNFVDTERPDATVLSLFDRDYMKKFLKTPAQTRLLQAFYDREDVHILPGIINAFKGATAAANTAVKAVDTAANTAVKAVDTAHQAYHNAMETGWWAMCNAHDGGDSCRAMRRATVEAARSVATGIRDAVRALTSCLGAGVATATGYGIKIPKLPPPGTNFGIGAAVSLSVGSGTSHRPITSLLGGEASGWASVTFAVGVVIGAIPGDSNIGGLRIGVGIAMDLSCNVNRIHRERRSTTGGYQDRHVVDLGACIFGVSVGAVAAAVIPGSSGSPLCIFGPTLVGLFGCFASVGVTVKILCCTVDLTNGCQNCNPKEENCGAAEAEPDILPPPINHQGQAVSSHTIGVAIGDDLAVKWANFCVEQVGAGVNYRGCQTKTLSGRTCQPWFKQTPHRHGFSTLDRMPNSVHYNSCANPLPSAKDGRDPRIWCYTEDPRVRWQFCQILFEKTTGGTARGQRCQFPFANNGRKYNRCIMTMTYNKKTKQKKIIGPWCRTVDRGVKPWRWAAGYCDSQETTGFFNQDGGVISGPKKCRFPLHHDGKTYHSCVIGGITNQDVRLFPHDKPWCYTGGGRRRSQGAFGICKTSVRPLGPMTHRRRQPTTTQLTGKALQEAEFRRANAGRRRGARW